MHDCPECGQACDCDGEDLWQDAPTFCEHDCGPEFEEAEEMENEYYPDEMPPETLWQRFTYWVWCRWDNFKWWCYYHHKALGICPCCHKPNWLHIFDHSECMPF